MSMKAARVAWVVLAAPAAIWGQTTAASFLNPLSPEGGIHLTGVSVYSGYFSSGGVGGFEMAVQNPFLTGPSAMIGVAASFGGSKSTEKSTFTWGYSPSYFNSFYGNNQFSNNGSMNHSGSLSWSRKFGSKWSLSVSLNGLLANLQQLYFNPSVLSSVASMPTTFDDLAAAMLARKYTDVQLASLLTGAPLQASVQQGYLYGDRMLGAGASVGLSWAPSERTSISATVTGSRYQHLNGNTDSTSGSAADYFVPQMTTAGIGISWSYSLSPRTQISASANSTRTFSSLQRGYTSNANVGFGRTMSRRWFMQLTAGAGRFNYSEQTYKAPSSVQYLYAASLGFKTNTQTFLASYSRSLGDAYGLGSGSTSSAIGTWNWRIPGRTWTMMASGGFQQLDNPIFQNTRSWQAGAGFARSLGPHFGISAQYVYFERPLSLNTAGVENSQNGVTVALNWSPLRYQ